MPKPQYKVCAFVTGGASGSYSDRMENSFVVLSHKYSKAELEANMLPDPQAYVDKLNETYVVDSLGLTPEQMTLLRESLFPGRPAPTEEEKKVRLKQQDEMSRKLSDLYAKQTFFLEALTPAGAALPRNMQVMFAFDDLSKESIEENRRFLEAFCSGSTVPKEEKKERLLRQLDKINQINLEVLDPTDPQSLLTHAADALRVTMVGAEMQPYMALLKEYGPDIAMDPRARKFIDRSNTLYELGGVIKPAMDCICSSLYVELGGLQQQNIAAYKSSLPAKLLRPEGQENELVINRQDMDEEDDSDVIEARKNPTIYNTYVIGDEVRRMDLSAHSTLKLMDFTLSVQGKRSPFLDNSRPMTQRLEHFAATNDHFKTREFLALPIRTDYSRQTGHFDMSSEEDNKLLDTYLYGGEYSGQYSVPIFHPAVPGDAERLYVKNEDGVYVPAFPQAKDPDFKGLTVQQVKEVLTSMGGKYVCFPAGETKPQYMDKGEWHSSEDVLQENGQTGQRFMTRTGELMQFGEEGQKRIRQEFTPEEKLHFENEERRHTLDCSFFDYQRVNEMEKAVYGSYSVDEGTEKFRSYQQGMVHSMRTQANPESITYPAPNGSLSEEDISALTLLGMTDPNVNGQKLPSDPTQNAIGGYEMVATDMYIHRENTQNSYYMQWATSARQAIKPQLAAYYKDGNTDALGATIAHGIHGLATSGSNNTSLAPDVVSTYVPACWVSDLLEKHPDLLAAARAQALRDGTAGLFESDLEKCRIQRNLYQFTMKVNQEERRLIDDKEGLLKNVGGQRGAHMDQKEKDQIDRDIMARRFLGKAALSYNNRTIEASPQLIQKALQEDQRIDRIEGLPALEKGLAKNVNQSIYLFAQKEKPMSPVFSLISQKGGLEALQSTLRKVPDVEDVDHVMGELYKRGLVPNKDGLADPLFDYKDAVNAQFYADTRGENDPLPAGATADMTPAQVNAVLLSNHAFKRENISAETTAIAQEMGLTYKEMKELAENQHLTIEQYGQNLRDENTYAETGKLPTDLQQTVKTLGVKDAQLKEDAAQKGMSYPAYVRQIDRQMKETLEELGMTEKEMQAHAKALGQNGYTYVQKMLAANEQAAAEPARPILQEQPKEKTGLAKLEDMLSGEKIGQLKPKQMCETLKELNEYSQRNCQDLYKTYQSGELLMTLYRHMYEYEKTHPELTREKNLTLRREDYVEAQKTVQRGVIAAQKMKSGDVVRNVHAEEIFRQDQQQRENPMLDGM